MPVARAAHPNPRGSTLKTSITLAVALAAFIATPAAAQWTRVTEVPVTNIFQVWVKGDTITAGSDSMAHVSTNGGVSWKTTAKIAAGVTSVQAVRIHKGRLYAGTFGQGVFVSNDLGDTWQPFSQGLTGGIANSHLFIGDMLVHGDSLIVATSGAGPYIRNLAAPSTWSHYGNVFEPNQSSNMNGIASGGSRLFACAGANGTTFFRDPGSPDWTLSWLNNVGIVPGLGAITAIWTGQGWVVGSNGGVFTSTLGQSPWSFVDVGLGTLFNVGFALRGAGVFAAFGVSAGTSIQFSTDEGATWSELEFQDFVFTFNVATLGSTLYAARFDGLWRRSIDNVSVPGRPAPERLHFALVGPHPVRDRVRLRFDLPEESRFELDVVDVAGRRVADRIEGARPAGRHEIVWGARDLAPGVYLARLTAAGRSETLRLVRAR